MRGHDRDIGMDRAITRRDFLNGVGVGLTSALVAPAWLEAWGVNDAQSPESAPDYYPPARTGMRGSHPGSFEIGHQLRDAKAWRAAATDTKETYDLVVVGGGISGLAAAHFFRAAAGPARTDSRFSTTTMTSAATPSATSSATAIGCCC